MKQLKFCIAMVQWMFWSVVYRWSPRPKSFSEAITKRIRTEPPFPQKPYLWHNDHAKKWVVYFDPNVPSYCNGTEVVPCEVLRSHDTGKIVGLIVFDETMGPREQ